MHTFHPSRGISLNNSGSVFIQWVRNLSFHRTWRVFFPHNTSSTVRWKQQVSCSAKEERSVGILLPPPVGDTWKPSPLEGSLAGRGWESAQQENANINTHTQIPHGMMGPWRAAHSAETKEDLDRPSNTSVISDLASCHADPIANRSVIFFLKKKESLLLPSSIFLTSAIILSSRERPNTRSRGRNQQRTHIIPCRQHFPLTWLLRSFLNKQIRRKSGNDFTWL